MMRACLDYQTEAAVSSPASIDLDAPSNLIETAVSTDRDINVTEWEHDRLQHL